MCKSVCVVDKDMSTLRVYVRPDRFLRVHVRTNRFVRVCIYTFVSLFVCACVCSSEGHMYLSCVSRCVCM